MVFYVRDLPVVDEFCHRNLPMIDLSKALDTTKVDWAAL